MMSVFNLCVSAFIISFAQLVFSDRVLSGLLVWLGIFFIYPWSAIGSVIAVCVAVLIHFFLNVYTHEQQEAGWSGFNAAIVGIFWGGGLANNSASITLLLVAVLLTIFLEALFKHALNNFKLPILSSPSMVTILMFSLILSENGQWYWTSVLAQYWYGYDVYMGVICIVIAMVLMNISATGWALSMAAMSFLLLDMIGVDVQQHLGFWALNVPLVVFAVLGVFFFNPLHKIFTALVAVTVVSLVWILWFITPLQDWIPPIVIPMILAIWVTLLAFKKYEASDYLSMEFWRIFSALWEAKRKNIPINLLVTPGGEVRNQLENLLMESERDQIVYDSNLWEIGQQFASGSTSILCREWSNIKNSSFFKNMLMLDGANREGISAGDKIVLLNEFSDSVYCMGCAESKPWPSVKLWRYAPLRCESCGDVVVPGSLIGWLSETYIQQKVVGILNEPSISLILSSKPDILIDRYIKAVAEISSQEILYLANGPLTNSDKNRNDREEAIVRRLKRLLLLLKIADVLSLRFFHMENLAKFKIIV